MCRATREGTSTVIISAGMKRASLSRTSGTDRNPATSWNRHGTRNNFISNTPDINNGITEKPLKLIPRRAMWKFVNGKSKTIWPPCGWMQYTSGFPLPPCKQMQHFFLQSFAASLMREIWLNTVNIVISGHISLWQNSAVKRKVVINVIKYSVECKH